MEPGNSYEKFFADNNDKSITVSSLNQDDLQNLQIISNLKNVLSNISLNVIIFFGILFQLTIWFFGNLKMYMLQKFLPIFRTMRVQSYLMENTPAERDDQVENIKEIIEDLKRHAVKAETAIISNFNKIKEQTIIQGTVMTENMNEKNMEISSLKSTLEEQEERLTSVQNQFKDIAKKLSSAVSPESEENYEHLGLEENYWLIVNNIQEMKNKMQSQNDLIKKMNLILNSLDELNKVNKNINEQNEKMNNIKVGLRRQSDSLVGNLKNIASQLNASTSLQEYQEEFQETNVSLAKIEENSEKLCDNIDLSYEHLKNQNPDEIFEETFNDIWRESSTLTVINKKNNSISNRNRKDSVNTSINNDNYESTSGVKKIQFLDNTCQTSFIEESNEIISMKNELHTRRQNLDTLTIKYEIMKKNLRDFRLEKNKVEESYKKTIADLEQKLSEHKLENDNQITECGGDPKSNTMNESSKHEQDVKYKIMITDLRQALKSMKNSYDETIKKMRNDMQHTEKIIAFIKNKLDAEKKNNQILKKRYETMTKDLLLQVEEQKKVIEDKEKENEKLVYVIDSLNKKISCLKSECEIQLKKKDAELTAYRNSFKEKNNEIYNLNEENKKIKIALQEKRIHYKTALKENYVNYCYSSYNKYNLNKIQSTNKENHTSGIPVHKFSAKEASPHITFRARKQN